jgi:hypothetical protein
VIATLFGHAAFDTGGTSAVLNGFGGQFENTIPSITEPNASMVEMNPTDTATSVRFEITVSPFVFDRKTYSVSIYNLLGNYKRIVGGNFCVMRLTRLSRLQIRWGRMG